MVVESKYIRSFLRTTTSWVCSHAANELCNAMANAVASVGPTPFKRHEATAMGLAGCVIDICRTLEKVCLAKGDPTASMVLANNLRQFRGQIQKEAATNARQITLGEAWGVISTT
jgi:hypothetical protein